MARGGGLQDALGEHYEAVLNQAMRNPTVDALARAMAGGPYKGVWRLQAVEEALSELAAARRTNNYRPIENEWGVPVPESHRPTLHGAVSRVLSRTKTMLALLTGQPREKFSDARVLDLLEGAWRYVAAASPAR